MKAQRRIGRRDAKWRRRNQALGRTIVLAHLKPQFGAPKAAPPSTNASRRHQPLRAIRRSAVSIPM